MRGLPIIVFAAFFVYTACALPFISKRTSFPAQGTLGPLQPRGPSEGKGKSKVTEEQAIHDPTCNNYGPAQYAWDKAELIKTADGFSLYQSIFQGKPVVIKAIPADKATFEQVVDEVKRLHHLKQVVKFAVKTTLGHSQGINIDTSHIEMYFIFMPHLGTNLATFPGVDEKPEVFCSHGTEPHPHLRSDASS